MGRKPRMEHEGAIYHLIQRGNNKEYIFQRKEDKKFLLDIIRDIMDECPFLLLGYVIMDNHYHLFVKLCETNMYRIMQRINNKYSKYYNSKYDRTGHVFQGRYKSIWVKDEKHLLSLLRYIHQNPVRAKMCEHVYDYNWSSDECYRLNKGNYVYIDLLLNMFSQDRKEALEQYKLFIGKEETMEEAKAFYEDCEVIQDQNAGSDHTNVHIHKEKPNLDEILLATGIDKQGFLMIKEGCRLRHLSDYKKKYVKEAYDYGFSMKEISSNINISCEAAYRMIKKEVV